MVHGGIHAVCATAGRARAATPRPREDAAALPNISIRRRPRTARPQRPLRIDRRLRAAWIAAVRRGPRACSRRGGSHLPRRRLAPNQSLPPLSLPEPAAATASPPPWVARRLQRAARVCGCPNGEVRRGGADRGWGRNGDEIGAVVAKTWPSDATEMDGREGVRYFHAVGRPVPSITEINIFQNTWWVNLITVQI
jgi:hypothetical protein